MGLELKNVWNVEDEFKDVITAVVDAVAGESAPRRQFSDPVYEAAQNVAVAYRSGHAVYKDYSWCVDKNADEAITALVEAVVDDAPRGPYGEAVYEAARKFGRSVWALKAVLPLQTSRH